jgi:hypothetical protein
MNEFLFLYCGGERPAGSPEQMQKQTQKWMSWIKELGERGHLKDAGHPLDRTGKIVKGAPKMIIDGPFAETKDIVGGYSLILAKDLSQAADLTAGCPILDIGGFVEVRPILSM